MSFRFLAHCRIFKLPPNKSMGDVAKSVFNANFKLGYTCSSTEKNLLKDRFENQKVPDLDLEEILEESRAIHKFSSVY